MYAEKRLRCGCRSNKTRKTRTTAAIRELLRDRDTKAEAAALAGKRLTARGRVSALFDEGTFVEIGALVQSDALLNSIQVLLSTLTILKVSYADTEPSAEGLFMLSLRITSAARAPLARLMHGKFVPFTTWL